MPLTLPLSAPILIGDQFIPLMENECPVTPPPELVASLRNSAPHGIRDAGVTRELWLINHAYAAGADQELEATLGLMTTLNIRGVDYVRNARRSARAPSLKEEALKQLRFLQQCGAGHRDTDKILRALEQLND